MPNIYRNIKKGVFEYRCDNRTNSPFLLLHETGIRLEKPSRPWSTTLPWSCKKCARKSFHTYKSFIELTDAVASKTEKRKCLSLTNSSGITAKKKRHQLELAGLVPGEEQELEETPLE